MKTNGLDFMGLMNDLESILEDSVVLISFYYSWVGPTQNPIGVDPTHEYWKEISDKNKKKLYPMQTSDHSFSMHFEWEN